MKKSPTHLTELFMSGVQNECSFIRGTREQFATRRNPRAHGDTGPDHSNGNRCVISPVAALTTASRSPTSSAT